MTCSPMTASSTTRCKWRRSRRSSLRDRGLSAPASC
jgi:hypothetical protein